MYEIPQQLEYKEKIVFGLTFKQLAYAFGFFPIIFFLIFKLNMAIGVRIFFAIYPITLAVGFIFFDLETKLKKWFMWFLLKEVRSKPKKGKLYKIWKKIPKKKRKRLIKIWKRMKKKKDGFWFKFDKWIKRDRVKEFFKIKKVVKNCIITNKNELAVLRVEPINFDIKPEKEKESIIFSFQKFLNSFDFPVQILMTTENLNVDDYLNSLETRIDGNSQKKFDEYKEHIKEVIKKDSISNRTFYLVIPKTTDLDTQIRICEERLYGLNLKMNRLTNSELKKLLKRIFNNKKGFMPKHIENNPFYMKINGKYMKTIYAHGYPRVVESGFLDRLVSSIGDFNLSLHIDPLPLETTMVVLNKELQKQRADLYAAKIKNQLNPSLKIKYRDTLKTLENLQKGEDKLFNLTFYITCKSNKKKELDYLVKKIESQLNSLLIIPKSTDFQMIQGFRSCLPLCEDSINKKRNITTKGLSAFFPFTSSFFKFDDTGIWFGLNKNRIPIIRDVFKLSNANGVCLASSGAGKSYMAKLFISRYFMNGAKVMVIDPQGEYRNLVRHFKGQLITLSRKSTTIINPLDLMGHDYIEKRLSLVDLMRVMLGEITEVQKAILDKAITETYENKGITDIPDTWDNEPPVLGDLLKVLETMAKHTTHQEKSTLRSLINRLNMYVNGVFSFFNQHTNLDFKNNFVCFDIGNLPNQAKPPMMFLVLDYIYTKMKSDLDRKILLIDESWSLLSRAEDAGYIFEIVKTCRKFNLGLLMINQEVEGLLDSKAGKSVLANSAYTLLMRQKPSVIDSIKHNFNLSSSERIKLLTANVGEGILIMEDDHSEIKIVASDQEHELITTNADELNEIHKRDGIRKSINIDVDVHKRFYKKTDLNKDEVKYLLHNKYKLSEHKSLGSRKKEEFLLKPRHNESLNHLFVTYDLANYIQKKGLRVEKYTTKKPDIAFNIGKKKYAIEIETGKVFSKVKNIREKVRMLNRDYDKWFFVVTNRNFGQKYSKFGDTCDMRYLKSKIDKILKKRAKLAKRVT